MTSKKTYTNRAERSTKAKRHRRSRRSRTGRAALLGAAVAGTVFAAVTGAQLDIN